MNASVRRGGTAYTVTITSMSVPVDLVKTVVGSNLAEDILIRKTQRCKFHNFTTGQK